VRAIKLILALLPLAYIGWLLFHFTGFQGWSDGPLAGGLGPTVLGLGAIGLIFCIPVIVKLLKMALVPSGAAKAKPGVDQEEAPAFDADAALARYLERKAAGQGLEIPPDPDAPRPVFGRKTG
jgi:hypothetical protein